MPTAADVETEDDEEEEEAGLGRMDGDGQEEAEQDPSVIDLDEGEWAAGAGEKAPVGAVEGAAAVVVAGAAWRPGAANKREEKEL